MSNFRTQIDEDLKGYAARYPEDSSMTKQEWAFNYWILDKFFNEDEELIVDKIIDYKDRGIDAYEWYEDTRELYLIQNKYYTTSKLTSEYVDNNFLLTPIGTLEKGTYTRCPELQKIFNQFRADEKFTVHLQLYVTNDLVDPAIEKSIKKFNSKHGHKYVAEVFYLKDIEEKWKKAKTTNISITILQKLANISQSTFLDTANPHPPIWAPISHPVPCSSHHPSSLTLINS